MFLLLVIFEAKKVHKILHAQKVNLATKSL